MGNTVDMDPAELGTGASSSEHTTAARASSVTTPSRAGDGPPATGYTSGKQPVESAAAIDGHPIHPMLVPLPIGALVGTVVADLAYARTGDRFWARAARYLTVAGLATGAAAAAPGLIDFISRERIRQRPEAWAHAAGNAVILGLAAVSAALRSRDERSTAAGPGLAISLTSVAILGVTGWLGGELAYRHRIGVTNT
jgi:uncharacterized membrane protein